MPLNCNNLDFSEFHPLDHPLWACHGYPGGWRRHLAYEWEFRQEPWLRTRTTCLLGWHRPGQIESRNDKTGPWMTWEACLFCAIPLSEKQPL